MEEAFGTLWTGYLIACKNYFECVQPHCYTEDALLAYGGSSAELSVVAFDLVGTLATIGLSHIFVASPSAEDLETRLGNAQTVASALASLISNNGICNSPCLDRHSQDITLAMTLLLLSGHVNDAVNWLKTLVRNVDYSYKAKKYVPICTDSLDDLPEDSGWNGEQASDRFMETSWTLATLAGWSAILDQEDRYELLAKEYRESYPDTCVQLWHPDENLNKHLYFHQAQFDCGASEAPIELPERASEWRHHIRTILASGQAAIANASPAVRAGIQVLDVVACRHFSTPIPPFFWYQFVDVLTHSDGSASVPVAQNIV